nr:MAG TPA: hypothetical protein [Caudoviricetes sp.]DAT26803.1 MAG TPA: hypothetical protein [Caudoviricetes sp.]
MFLDYFLCTYNRIFSIISQYPRNKKYYSFLGGVKIAL